MVGLNKKKNSCAFFNEEKITKTNTVLKARGAVMHKRFFYTAEWIHGKDFGAGFRGKSCLKKKILLMNSNGSSLILHQLSRWRWKLLRQGLFHSTLKVDNPLKLLKVWSSTYLSKMEGVILHIILIWSSLSM